MILAVELLSGTFAGKARCLGVQGVERELVRRGCLRVEKGRRTA